MEEDNLNKIKTSVYEQNNYIYFIVSNEKDIQLNLYLSKDYKLANTLSLIDKQYIFNQNNIIEIKIYRFQMLNLVNEIEKLNIIIKDDNNYENKYTIAIKDYNKNYFLFNFYIGNLGLIHLEHERQYEVYINILKNKYKLKKESKEFNNLISSSVSLFADENYKFNFLFYLILFLDCLKTENIEEILSLFNYKKIKGLGELSQKKINEVKNQIKLFLNDIDQFNNIKNLEKIKDLFYLLTFYFNYCFQNENIQSMIDNPIIVNSLFNYFTHYKYIFPNLIIEKKYMNIFLEKVKDFNELSYLLYYLGNDCLQFISFINNNFHILSKISKFDKDKTPQIEIDNYIKYKENDDVSKISKQIDLLIENEKKVNEKFIKFGPIMLKKYMKFDEGFDFNKDTLEHMINSIKEIDEDFELQTIINVYFIESHEKSRNIKIKLTNDLFDLEKAHILEIKRNKKLFTVTIYSIKLYKERIKKNLNENNEIQINIILEDENNIKFEKIIDIPNNEKNIFIINLYFPARSEFTKIIFPPESCNFTINEIFEIYFSFVKNELKLDKDEETKLIIDLIKAAQSILLNINLYSMSFYIYILIECFNIKELLFQHLMIFDIKKIDNKFLKKMNYYKTKELLKELLKFPDKEVEKYKIKDQNIFLEKVCFLILIFYNYYEKEKIDELFNNNYNNQIMLLLYRILIKNPSLFTNLQIKYRRIKEMIKISRNFNELVNSISYNDDFLEVMKLINDYHKDFVEKFDETINTPIETEKIINPKKEDSFNEILKLILDIILYEKINGKYFIYFSPSLLYKSFQSLDKINSHNFMVLNEIIYILREKNNEFRLKNDLNDMVYRTGLQFIEKKGLKNSELLKFIKMNTYYNEINFEKNNYRDLKILKGIDVNKVDSEFKNKWKEIDWLTIFKSQEKNFFETVCSLVDNISQFHLLFELLYDLKQFNYYKVEILNLIYKVFINNYKKYTIHVLTLNIEFLGKLIFQLDQNNLNPKKVISDVKSSLGKDFLLYIYSELINKKYELSSNVVKIISNYFSKNVNKMNINFLIFLLKYYDKEDKYIKFLDKYTIKYKDFIDFGESDNLRIFTRLLENNVIKDKKINKTKYYIDAYNEANYAISEISKLNIRYSLVKRFFEANKEDILFQRIKLLTNFINDINYEKYKKLIQDSYIKSNKIIDNLDLIYKDYIYFYPNDKIIVNKIFQKEIDELKESDLRLILNSENKYKKYLDYKESSDLRKKYLKSKIFNSIYTNKKLLFKNDDIKIIEESEKEFYLIKDIIIKGKIKNINKYNLISLFSQFKNNENELVKELDILIDIFYLENINKSKIIKGLTLLLYQKDEIINAIKNLIFLIELTESQKNEVYKLFKEAILKNITKTKGIKVIELCYNIIKIHGFESTNYKYLNFLNEFKDDKNNQYIQSSTDINPISNFINIIKKINKIKPMKDKTVVKLFKKFISDIGSKNDNISCFYNNFENEELINEEFHLINNFAQYLYKIYQNDVDSKNDNKIKLLINKNENNYDELINILILLKNKNDILAVFKSLILFIEEVGVEKKEFTKLINNLLEAIEAINKNNLSQIFLYIINNSEIKFNNEENDYIKLFVKFYNSKDSIKLLFSITFDDYRLLIQLINKYDNESIINIDILSLEKSLKFIKNLGNKKELKNMSDFGLIQKIISSLENDKNNINYLNNYLDQFEIIKKLFDKGLVKPFILNYQIYNICKNSAFILSNKENSFYEGYCEINKFNEKNKINIKLKTLRKLKQFIELNVDKDERTFFEINKIFIELTSNIKELLFLLNNLHDYGYIYEIIIEIKVIDNIINYSYSIFNNKKRIINEKLEISNLLSMLNEIFNKFTKSQINGYRKSILLRAIFGVYFNIIYKAISKNDNNNNNNIIKIMKFITNNIIENVNIINFNLEERVEYDNFLDNCKCYIEKTLIANNISIDQIYEKNIIKPLVEFNSFRGIFIYKCINIEKELFQLCKYLTGNYPFLQNFLICNNETSIQEIISFLYRSILCSYHSCFIIGGIDSLNDEIKNNFFVLLKNIINETNGIINSCLIILNSEKESDITEKLESIKYNNFNENSKNEVNKQILDDITRIKMISSDKSGIEKSTIIQNDISKRNKNYIYFPLEGELEQKIIIQRIESLNISKNSVLHLDLFDTDNLDLIEEFLFYIIITKSFIKNMKIYYFPKDLEVYIELQNSYDMGRFTILSLIKQKEEFKLTRKNFDPLIFSKYNKSDLIIVCKYLKLIINLNNDNKICNFIDKNNNNINIEQINQINEYDIDLNLIFNDEIINDEECKKLIFEIIEIEDFSFSYYKIELLIKLLAFLLSQLYHFSLVNSSSSKTKENKIKNFIILYFLKIFNNYTDNSYKFINDKSIFKHLLLNDYNINEDLKKTKSKIINLIFLKDNFLPLINNYELLDSDYINKIKILLHLFNPFHNKDENFYNKIPIKRLADSFILTKDSLIKMALILIKLQANIPVIIIDEPCSGKSSLVQQLYKFSSYGNLYKLKVFNFYPETKGEEIIKFINSIISEEEKLEQKKSEKSNFVLEKRIWILLKNINTCKSMGLIKELICNHSLQARKLTKSMTIIATCNPELPKEKDAMEKNNNKGTYKFYSLPNSLKDFVLNFCNINQENEQNYIKNIINMSIEKMNDNLNNEKIEEIKELTKLLIIQCHKLIKENYDKSYLSIKDIKRFIKFYTYFFNYLNFKKEKKLYDMNPEKKFDFQKFTEFEFHIYSINLSIYICYYLKIPHKDLRKRLTDELNKIFKYSDFLFFPQNEQNFLIDNMEISKEIKINDIKENIFSLFFGLNSKTPIFIVDQKNKDKLISLKLMYKSMKGSWSNNSFFKLFPKIILYSYNELTDICSKDLNEINSKINSCYDKLRNEDYSVFYFEGDEIKIPLYFLNNELEEKNIFFVGISNKLNKSLEINNVLYVINPEK